LQRAREVEPAGFLRIRRMARIERARFTQARARARPIGGRGGAALEFPALDQVARFEGAQISKAAG